MTHDTRKCSQRKTVFSSDKEYLLISCPITETITEAVIVITMILEKKFIIIWRIIKKK